MNFVYILWKEKFDDKLEGKKIKKPQKNASKIWRSDKANNIDDGGSVEGKKKWRKIEEKREKKNQWGLKEETEKKKMLKKKIIPLHTHTSLPLPLLLQWCQQQQPPTLIVVLIVLTV